MHSLDAKTKQLIERSLGTADEKESHGPRLLDDAERLWGRVQIFLRMNLLPGALDEPSLELACFALQFPLRQLKLLPTGRPGRTSLLDRAEQAAEMLVGLLGGQIDEAVLDRTTQLLHELPQRNPIHDEARLLADAVNLEDFGVTGLFLQCYQSHRAGTGITQFAAGLEKREQYGYWEARLKDGFHFDAVRKIAQHRLENARRAATLLFDELKEDRPQ